MPDTLGGSALTPFLNLTLNLSDAALMFRSTSSIRVTL